jgi:hypothetical protein
MIEITKFAVRTFDIDHLDLTWSMANTNDNPLDYRFEILRSVDGPVGPFNVIGLVVHNQYVFRDPDVHRLHKWRTYYYTIRITHIPTQTVKDFGPEWLRCKPDRIALEMQRREQLLWREFAGKKSVLFPVLTTGARCSTCWEVTERGNTIGRSRQQNCGTCFDTTFVGGYATPMIVWIQFDPFPETIVLTDVSEETPVNTTARICAFPPVSPRDMIVDDGGDRWEVQKITPTRKLGAIVRQELELHFIQRADVRYKVPVSLEEPTAPEREFTRPMDIQARS